MMPPPIITMSYVFRVIGDTTSSKAICCVRFSGSEVHRSRVQRLKKSSVWLLVSGSWQRVGSQ